MPAPMTLSMPALIGIVLAGFLVGLLIATLSGNRRVRRVSEESDSRLGEIKRNLAKRDSELSTLRSESDSSTAAVEAAQNESASLKSQLQIAQAQLDEIQSGAGDIEDRLSAAEARLLSADAEVARSRADIAQWSSAYAQLKAMHGRLTIEHGEAQERRQRVEEELKERRTELQELSARMEALQEAQNLQLDVRSADASELQQTVAAISLARAEAEASLRTREIELSDLRSQTASMRYSLNVLTASGAQLAQMLAEQNVIDADAQWLESRAAALPAIVPPTEAAAEDLADLQGVIRDWYSDIEPHIPYDRHTLLLFGGHANEDRFAEHVLQTGAPHIAAETTAGEPAGPVTAHRMADLPPAIMLAAIKAATATALERSSARQFELARDLVTHQEQLDALRERVMAWRAMLSLTLGDDPETLRLLDDQVGADPIEMLSACATVALTAYQKKADALARAQGAIPPERGPAALPRPSLALSRR